MTKPTVRKRETYHVGNLVPLLLSAAREMLEEVGPTKLSMRALSERVGVSSAAIYHHYSNRAELIVHLAALGFRELGKVHAVRDKTVPSLQKLRAGCLTYLNFARSNPALYQLMFGPECSAEPISPVLLKAREEAFNELMEAVAEILNLDKEIEEVHDAAFSIWSYTHGLASLVIHGAMQPPPNTTEEGLIDKTLQGFAHLLNATQTTSGSPT